ncbi:MAG: 50S ribosomal protein L25 [Planctomycetaceae bacterium]|jgi:large subunit ribosomal protein L25|nr:50S ribosomal protein L25 [Planctomycetaceae bacterium]
MAKAFQLTVSVRDTHGKRRNRRMRESGFVPAVLYGHKQDTVSLSIKADEIDAAIRHGNRFVALAGGLNEKAFIKSCQWDTWGTTVLHVDFTRASEHEKIQVTLPVELHGEAPGVKEGGVVKLLLHELRLECEAADVPEKIAVNINHLEFNQVLTVSDIKLPTGSKSLVDVTLAVVSCVAQTEAPDEEGGEAGENEPEVIGRKKEDAEEGE